MNTISSLLKNLRNRTPVGSIEMYAGSNAPTDWLKCDGSAVSRETFEALFRVIGTTYGAGDGTTTFNLPDMRNRMPIGAGSTYALNAKGGSTGVPYHTHTLTRTTNVGVSAHGITQPTFNGPAHTHGSGVANTSLLATASAIERKEASGSSSANTYYGTSPIVRTPTSSAGTGACTRTTNVALTNNHVVTQPVFSCSYAGSSGDNNLPPYTGINFIIYAGTTA